jgi:hypothetical protein
MAFCWSFKAFDITEDPKYSANNEYAWKGFVIMGGIYLFYLVERIMKIILSIKQVSRFHGFVNGPKALQALMV